MLVVGGGYGTVKTVLAALQAKGGSTACPVVLVPEAKGAGQFLYEAVHLSTIYTPEEVAERWYETEDNEIVSHVTKEELGGLLREVVALSMQPLAHSANGDLPVKFFHTARDDNHDLREILLNAILDDCRSTQQAIRLAVQWGDAKITRLQLQESNQADPSSLRVELETALLAADYNMVKVLVDFKADPSKVRLNRLVGRSVCRGPSATTDCWEDMTIKVCEQVAEKVAEIDEYDRMSRCPGINEINTDKRYKEIREWCDPRSAAGFAVLAHWMGELGGYVSTHLECRYLHQLNKPNRDAPRAHWCPDSKLRPEWSDIFLWAVLVSQPEIAKLLWTKTDDPLRMAVYASLLCHKVAQGCQEGLERAELIEQADAYEAWAMALLEEAPAQ